MKYYRVPIIEFEGETFPEAYFEVGEERNYERVLLILPDKMVGSTFPHYLNPYTQQNEMTVPEGLAELSEEEILEIEKEEIPQILLDLPEPKPISKKEFEYAWHRYLDEWKDYWDGVKKTFEINQIERGKISLFYFTGVVIQLRENAFGFIPSEVCEKAETASGIVWGSGMQISVKVTGYDEMNMWLRLEYQSISRK